MEEKFRKMNKGRFCRISNARILDGHPLKLTSQGIFIMVPAFMIITSVISFLFVFLHDTEYALIFWSMLPGGLLGLLLLVLERSLGILKNFLFPRMGKLLTAFLLFFIHIIGYIVLSSIVVSYPVGYIMGLAGEMAGLAGKYSLFSVNFFIVFALLSWLRNVRSAPFRCF